MAGWGVPQFQVRDLHLHYEEWGDPDGRPLVLMHGLLLSSQMMRRFAGHLPHRRVILLDLHGHGRSSKPTDAARYTWPSMVDDVVGLLDHLGLERAVVGGLSLGANVALATAHAARDRVAAMILEMPVLLRGVRFGRPAFGALASIYASGTLRPAAGLLARVRVPTGIPDLGAVIDAATAAPEVASALLRGLLAEPLEPWELDRFADIDIPALVIGHRGDPLHVLADCRDLAARLPQGKLIEAPSFFAYRLNPERLADRVRTFLDDAGV